MKMSAEIRVTASRIHGWLWNHILFVAEPGQHRAFMVQMGRLGKSGFFGVLTRMPVN